MPLAVAGQYPCNKPSKNLVVKLRGREPNILLSILNDSDIFHPRESILAISILVVVSSPEKVNQ